MCEKRWASAKLGELMNVAEAQQALDGPHFRRLERETLKKDGRYFGTGATLVIQNPDTYFTFPESGWLIFIKEIP